MPERGDRDGSFNNGRRRLGLSVGRGTSGRSHTVERRYTGTNAGGAQDLTWASVSCSPRPAPGRAPASRKTLHVKLSSVGARDPERVGCDDLVGARR